MKSLITSEAIQSCIYQVRGQKIILDVDLARFYGVSPKALNQAVKRNPKKFPDDFTFQLQNQEVTFLRSHFVTANISSKSRSLPYVFTEHGALMAANVLRSPKANQMSVLIIRAFIGLRDENKQQEKIVNHILEKLSQHDEEIAGLSLFLNEILKMQKKEKKFLN